MKLRDGSELDFAGMVSYLAGERMAKQYIPERLEIVDTLPRTGTNKVEKNKLAQQGLSANVWDAGA